jgi:hypothetical protein
VTSKGSFYRGREGTIVEGSIANPKAWLIDLDKYPITPLFNQDEFEVIP